MANPILRITNGSNSVNLLAVGSGILLDDWTPSIAQLKGGGTYQQSVLSDSKQLVMANYDNAVETMSLKTHGESQDTVIEASQDLLRLLESARAYWFTPFHTEPVWLVARAPDETNTRYAIIHNYRQEGLDNPYAVPFFGCGSIAMDNISLVIERGHWQNVEPGTGECVEIAGSKGSSASAVTDTIAADADDGYAQLSTGHTATWFTATGNIIAAGGAATGGGALLRLGLFVRFSSVAIPVDATITRAYMVFTAQRSFEISPPEGNGIISYRNNKLTIYGDDSDNATAPTDVATWNAKPITTNSRSWWPPDGTVTAGDKHATVDIIDIVNEIRDRGGWFSGNALQFFVEEEACLILNYYVWAAREDPIKDEAQLVIEYTVPSGAIAATCENQVWLVDKSHTSGIEYVYLWDGAAWSANLIDDATIDLTDDPAAVGDKAYFSSTGGPFNNIVLNITQHDADSEITIVWEYWQGAPANAWTQFGATKIIDKTVQYTTPGFNSVTFVPPMDTTNGSWVSANLNSISGDGTPPNVTGWWIRARVTAVSGAPDPVQVSGGSDNLYTVTWPNVAVDSEQLGGDIPAVGRISLDSSGQLASSPTVRHRVVAALSSDRGPYGNYDSYDFSAYLPFSDEQTPPVMSAPTIAGDYSFVDDVTAPSGRCVLLDPSGVGADSFYVTVNSLHYFGSYRVFVRARQLGGVDNDFKVGVATSHDGVIYAQTKYVGVTVQSTTTAPNWQLLDLGLIDIPTGLPARTADEGVDIDLYINTTINDDTGDLYFMDLILMPTDEWIVDVQDLGVLGFSEGKFLHIDSLNIPKVDMRALTKYGGSPEFAEPLPWKALGSQIQIPANVGCKIWVVMARLDGTDWISDGITTARVQLFSAEQYLGLRGSR